MASNDKPVSVLKMIEQAPLPQIVQSLAASLADAQNKLLQKSAETFLTLAKAENGVKLPGEDKKRSLLELGFEPLFLHISEATITARMAFSATETTESGGDASVGLTYGILSASVNAHYSNKYSFSAEGASEIRAKIISVPAPTALTERMAQLRGGG